MNRILRTLSLLLAASLICGVCSCAPVERKTTAYYGPTEPMAAVAEKINKNNEDIPTVWATHYFEADIHEENNGKTHFANGNGVLMYKRGAGFRLVGTKEGYGTVFEAGSDSERYWLKLGKETMYFGEHRHLGKPCVQSIPIQPNLVMEVLGVGMIDTNFLQMPAPVMRFNPDADCYMFVWVAPVGGKGAGAPRLAAQKEIWYDRKTYLPRQVMLFDANGRVLLRAILANHKAVGENDGQIATTYSLFFPDTRSKMSIEIKDLRLENKGIPTRRGIAFPGSQPSEAEVNKVIKLDANCTD